MRAAILEEPAPAAAAPLTAVDVPVPEPEAGEARVKVSACAVCRTDLQLAEGDVPPHRRPVIPGHQVVGRGDAVGPGADADAVVEKLHRLKSNVDAANVTDNKTAIVRMLSIAACKLAVDQGQWQARQRTGRDWNRLGKRSGALGAL